MATTRRDRKAPDPAKIAAIGCALERAAIISRFARKVSHLPSTLAAMRVAAVREAHEEGCSKVTIADALNLTRPRVSQLLAEANAANPSEVAA